MSTTPSHQPSGSPTRVVGQETAPSTVVPHNPGGAMYTPAGTKTNTLAIVSLVTGIGSFFGHIIPFLGGFTIALVAIVTGYMARKQIQETGEGGMGIATAGMVIGIAHLLLVVLVVMAVLLAIFAMGIALFGVSRH